MIRLEFINGSLVPDMLAGLGILQVPHLTTVDETDDQIAAKLALIAANNGPVFYVSTNDPAQFFNRSVMYHTKSWASHSGVIIPEGWAREVRLQYPNLLQRRTLDDVLTDIRILPPVPAEVKGMEVVESQATVAISDPAAVVKRGEFMVAFLRDWTDAQAMAITRAAYWLYGAPYDVWEIARKVGLPFPKFKQIFVCSSLTAWAAWGKNPDLREDDPINEPRGDTQMRQWFIDRQIDPDEPTPADDARYWFSNGLFRLLAFRCNLAEAWAKI